MNRLIANRTAGQGSQSLELLLELRLACRRLVLPRAIPNRFDEHGSRAVVLGIDDLG